LILDQRILKLKSKVIIKILYQKFRFRQKLPKMAGATLLGRGWVGNSQELTRSLGSIAQVGWGSPV
jgi:transcriptional regulator of acetoin/glycerol metabolism